MRWNWLPIEGHVDTICVFPPSPLNEDLEDVVMYIARVPPVFPLHIRQHWLNRCRLSTWLHTHTVHWKHFAIEKGTRSCCKCCNNRSKAIQDGVRVFSYVQNKQRFHSFAWQECTIKVQWYLYCELSLGSLPLCSCCIYVKHLPSPLWHADCLRIQNLSVFFTCFVDNVDSVVVLAACLVLLVDCQLCANGPFHEVTDRNLKVNIASLCAYVHTCSEKSEGRANVLVLSMLLLCKEYPLIASFSFCVSCPHWDVPYKT